MEKRIHSGAWGSAVRKFCSQPLHRRRRPRAVQQYRTTMELSPSEFMPFDVVDTVDIMNNVATAAGGVAAGAGGFIDDAQLGALSSIVCNFKYSPYRSIAMLTKIRRKPPRRAVPFRSCSQLISF